MRVIPCSKTLGHGTGEAILRKRIQELQHYRRMGLTTPADIDKYDMDVIKRVRTPFVVLGHTLTAHFR